MRSFHFIVVLIALSSVAVAAGCGSDGGSDAEASADAKAAFVKQANAICAERGAEVRTKGVSIVKNAGSGPEAAPTRELVDDVVVPAFEKEIRELGALEPPPGDAEQVEAILSATQELIDRLQADPSERGIYPYRRVEDLSAAYGLSKCGHP